MLPCSEKDQPHIYSICMHIYIYIYWTVSKKQCTVWSEHMHILSYAYIHIYIYIHCTAHVHTVSLYWMQQLDHFEFWNLPAAPPFPRPFPSFSMPTQATILSSLSTTTPSGIGTVHHEVFHIDQGGLGQRADRWCFFLWLVNVVTGPVCIYIYATEVGSMMHVQVSVVECSIYG